MKSDLRADAMWLATHWAVIGASEDASHPTWIRKEHRDLQSSQAPSPDLDIAAPADAGLERLAKVAPVARRVNALAAHAAGAGPEAETAEKHDARRCMRLATPQLNGRRVIALSRTGSVHEST